MANPPVRRFCGETVAVKKSVITAYIKYDPSNKSPTGPAWDKVVEQLLFEQNMTSTVPGLKKFVTNHLTRWHEMYDSDNHVLESGEVAEDDELTAIDVGVCADFVEKPGLTQHAHIVRTALGRSPALYDDPVRCRNPLVVEPMAALVSVIDRLLPRVSPSRTARKAEGAV